MRVSRAEAAENRERIVDTAARLFREGGFASTGVDKIMSEAGLTHGGFYGHFSSKDQLAAEACSKALARSFEKWKSLAQNDEPLSAIISHYLSTRHRDNPGDGCLISALATEAGRSSPTVRQSFTAGLQSLLSVLKEHTTDDDKLAGKDQAISMLASLVGAIVLSRAVDDTALSDAILQAVSASVSPKRKPRAAQRRK